MCGKIKMKSVKQKHRMKMKRAKLANEIIKFKCRSSILTSNTIHLQFDIENRHRDEMKHTDICLVAMNLISESFSSWSESKRINKYSFRLVKCFQYLVNVNMYRLTPN